MNFVGNFHDGMENTIIIFLLLVLMLAPGLGMETKTAYTRDDINFVSKERVDENIRYEYAKQGDYREVQVSLDTVVLGASAFPANISLPEEKKEIPLAENLPSQSNSTSKNKYPYANLSIGLLIMGGLIFFVAYVFSGRDRR